MVTLLEDPIQFALFSFFKETFHSANMNVLGSKENEKSSDIVHLFTGMALYVKDDPPFSYLY